MSHARLVRNFFGAMLMAIGGLIAGLCGLCTGTYELIFIYGFLKSGGFPDFLGLFTLLIPFLFGVVPIGLGLLLFLVGRSLWKDDPNDVRPAIPPSDE